MNQFKISTRLMGLIVFFSMLLVLIGSVGLYSSNVNHDALGRVYLDRTVPLKDLASINYLVNRNRILIMDALMNPDPKNVERRASEIRDNEKEILALWAGYMKTKLTTEESALAKEYESQVKEFLVSGVRAAVEKFETKDADGAMQLYKEIVSPKAPAVQKTLNSLLELQTNEAKREYEDSDALFKSLMSVSIGVIIVGVLIGFSFGLILLRGISAALEKAKQAATAVAQGDLSARIDASGSDEIADVLKQMQQMQAGLANMVKSVRNSAQELSNASAEIASGNQDLSSRTEAQASSLEETAASMEEMSATVNQNAQTAEQAKQLAVASSVVAKNAGQVVQSVVKSMNDISSSSQKISDIIGVIDGIAFQTNILALNAAVEAARAGEQGRGFAVVAGEVRTLAQRSAQAAKEIKELISTSAQNVQQGEGQVERAGQTMIEVVDGIDKLSRLMQEISAASAEQSSGVAQIGEAVQQMDQATQQNAALVEEMAAAATSLNNQAQELVRSVAVFKV